jgi:hypothetical protein
MKTRTRPGGTVSGGAGGCERGGQMADKHHEGERARCCVQADGSCVGLTVSRLSQQRVRELAEEIWTASTGQLLPVRPTSDPRSSRPGASARALEVLCPAA